MPKKTKSPYATLSLSRERMERLRRLALTAGYAVKVGPKSQLGDFLERLMDEHESDKKASK
ncbi:MAG: hypothetical protein L0287_35645 [Anaerolineae bacterium]|nr:hypothetical protein [Anaerolineae bacterium]